MRIVGAFRLPVTQQQQQRGPAIYRIQEAPPVHSIPRRQVPPIHLRQVPYVTPTVTTVPQVRHTVRSHAQLINRFKFSRQHLPFLKFFNPQNELTEKFHEHHPISKNFFDSFPFLRAYFTIEEEHKL